jgi:hypothetical protein
VGAVAVILAAIQVADTRFGRGIGRGAQAVGKWLAQTGVGREVRDAASQVVRVFRGLVAVPGPFWLVLVLLVVIWYLSLFTYEVSTNRDWSGAFGFAFVGSLVALAIAFGLRYERRRDTVVVKTAPQDGEKEKRIVRLRRQIYALAGSLLKYADPKTYTATRWDQIEPLNSLLYSLTAQGEDVTAFVIPFLWREELIAGPGTVNNSLLVPRLEGLLVYLKTVGLPSTDS